MLLKCLIGFSRHRYVYYHMPKRRNLCLRLATKNMEIINLIEIIHFCYGTSLIYMYVYCQIEYADATSKFALE